MTKRKVKPLVLTTAPLRNGEIMQTQHITHVPACRLAGPMEGLAPNHNTIANFRRDNPKAIRKIFQATVSLAKNFDPIGAKLLVGDSTKLRMQNSKKNNLSIEKFQLIIELEST